MTIHVDELPRMVIEEQHARIARAFPGARGDTDGMLGELRRATRGWTPADLMAAVDAVIREERNYPRIATILKHRPEAPQSAARPDEADACRLCRVVPYLGGYETAGGELVPRYRCDCPQRAPGWNTDRALAWTPDHESEEAA